MRRGGRAIWLGAVALLGTLLALGACGGRLGAAHEPATDRSAPAATPGGPGLTPLAAPVTTADLSALERLLDQLTEALASDAAAPNDEGSPR